MFSGKIVLGKKIALASGNIGIVEIPLIDSFQVDTHEDLELIRRIKQCDV